MFKLRCIFMVEYANIHHLLYSLVFTFSKLAQCVYRKCSATCPSPEDDRKRIFGGEEESLSSSSTLSLPKPIFNRTSYCCQDNLCNAGERSAYLSVGVVLLALVMHQVVD